MKKPAFLLTILAVVVFAFAQLTTSKNKEIHHEAITYADPEFPEGVKAIIDKSCYGCHSEKGKNDDAKEALRWDLMGEYDKEKLVSIMDEIIEVIEKQEMPPEKFLERFPDNKPSDEQYATLKAWAEGEADKLLE